MDDSKIRAMLQSSQNLFLNSNPYIPTNCQETASFKEKLKFNSEYKLVNKQKGKFLSLLVS